MKLKYKIIIEILLVIAAIAVFVYNFSTQRETAYIASIVAVCGTIALLVKDVVKLKKDKWLIPIYSTGIRAHVYI